MDSNNPHAPAHHEAAHAVVAEHLGCGPTKIELESHSRNGSTWIDGCCYHALAGPHEQKMISLSGAIGEVLSGPCAGNWGAALLHPVVARVSRADLENMGGAYSIRDMDQALALVRSLWPVIEARAAKEIAIFNSRATPATL